MWLYFSYDSVANRTKCIIEDDEGNPCNHPLTGKNPTNIKAHLGRAHKAIYKRCIEKDVALRVEKKVNAKPAAVGLIHTQTVGAMFSRHGTVYLAMSNEQLEREQDLTDWFVETGLPYQIVDGPAFRRIFRRVDPKFTVPGKNVICVSIFHLLNSLTARVSAGFS